MTIEDSHSAIECIIDTKPWYLLGVKTNKAPVTRNGVKDATRSKERLHALASVNKDMNLAIEVGERSGVLVIDTDMPKSSSDKGINGEEALKRYFGDKFTFDYNNHLWARTPSGGLHLYFEYDQAFPVSSKIGILERVDLKANGYVLVEPSIVVYPSGKSGKYKFNDINKPLSPLLPWVKELILLEPSSNTNSSINGVNYAEAISGIPEGKREQSIFILAWEMKKQNISQDIATSFLQQVASNCSPPFSSHTTEMKIRRAYSIKFSNTKAGGKS